MVHIPQPCSWLCSTVWRRLLLEFLMITEEVIFSVIWLWWYLLFPFSVIGISSGYWFKVQPFAAVFLCFLLISNIPFVDFFFFFYYFSVSAFFKSVGKFSARLDCDCWLTNPLSIQRSLKQQFKQWPLHPGSVRECMVFNLYGAPCLTCLVLQQKYKNIFILVKYKIFSLQMFSVHNKPQGGECLFTS